MTWLSNAAMCIDLAMPGRPRVHRSLSRTTGMLCAALFVLQGCASLDLPSIEESDAMVRDARSRIDRADSSVQAWSAKELPGGSEVVTRVRMHAINRVLSAFAGNRSDDVRLRFLPSRGIVREDKAVLGVSYTNTLDIDGGELTMNLKTLRFDKFERGTADATIEIEGSGRISASGRYTGVPASASPVIELRLADRISFDVRTAEGGAVEIAPRAKTLKLRATFKVKLLQWDVPWTQDIPLEVRDLIPPVRIPVALSSDVPFPVPAAKAGDEKFDYVPYRLVMSRTQVRTLPEMIEMRSDVDFVRK